VCRSTRPQSTSRARCASIRSSKRTGRAAGTYVTFEPYARSDWHTHPLGQTLIVTFGCGLHQRWGGPIEEIRPGDPTTAMTHIAIQEALDGKPVDWLEKVTDEQYLAGPPANPGAA
jgi:quercetin dioxygenase-like cupin family protein